MLNQAGRTLCDLNLIEIKILPAVLYVFRLCINKHKSLGFLDKSRCASLQL